MSKEKMIPKKEKYEPAVIEEILLSTADIITTSTDLGDGKDIDDGGWTSTTSW